MYAMGKVPVSRQVVAASERAAYSDVEACRRVRFECVSFGQLYGLLSQHTAHANPAAYVARVSHALLHCLGHIASPQMQRRNMAVTLCSVSGAKAAHFLIDNC